jgi:hypothetical protein
MRQITNYAKVKAFIALLIFSSLQQVLAQDKVEVNGHDVGSWFSNHWMWVAGAIVLLVIIVLMGSGSSSSKTKSTTVVKDDMGNVKSITTTEKNT